MLQADGRIRYLNTAGFAIRRTRANIEAGVFDPAALRAEDTLLLADLMQGWRAPVVRSRCNRRTLHTTIFGWVLTEGHSFRVLRKKDVQRHRLEGGTNSFDSARASAIDSVHVEDCHQAQDRLGVCLSSGRRFCG
jgi:hypothetical protein